ncbi:hypothetical protein AAU61_21035 [Desulfocarbo indianensis]|nr:hypothetical protein AAU61_21035 [Desulfocarbo indianensis]
METMNTQPRGLTRLIYENLVALTPEVLANGESWTPELLDRVEHDLHQRLAPSGSKRQELIFNMVFRRSFAEARDLVTRKGYLDLTHEDLNALGLLHATA